MGTLVMSFRGLCMHLNRDRVPSPLPEDIQHRVVAVNANDGAVTTFANLPPHRAFLEVDAGVDSALREAGLSPDATGTYPLLGVNLRVKNARGRNRPMDTNLEHVPCLSDYLAGMVLRPDILQDKDVPSEDDCYVDMFQGTLTNHTFPAVPGGTSGGGVYTTWTVETENPNEDPILEWARRGVPVLEVPIPSTPAGAHGQNSVPGSIVLRNSTMDLTDGAFDFALFYLAAVGGIPDTFTKPPPMDPDHVKPDSDMTTSCSNSQYP